MPKNEAIVATAGNDENVELQGKEEKVEKTFTQADVDRILRKRLSEVTTKYETILEELKTQPEPKQKPDNASIDPAKVEEIVKPLMDKVKKLEGEYQEAKGKLATRTKEKELLEAIGNKVVKPEQAIRLLDGSVIVKDDMTCEVVDSNKNPRVNANTGKLMTLPELVDEFIEQNPHFVPFQTKAGAGVLTPPTNAPAGLPQIAPSFEYPSMKG